MTTDGARDERRASWRDKAACLDHPAEWFTDPAPGDTRRAIEVCQSCPVKQPCLDAALEIEASADLGIWGGTTPATRRRLRRSAAREAGVDIEGEAAIKAAHVNGRPPRLERAELFEDAHGDHTDRTGRIIVFEIHGDPPMMLMIDGRPTARTRTVEDAAGLADVLLHKKTAEQPAPWRELRR